MLSGTKIAIVSWVTCGEFVEFVFRTGPYSRPFGVSMRMRICLVSLFCLSIVAGCTNAKSTDVLISDLGSADEGDRIKAVRWLQHRRGDAAKVVPVLIESLQDSSVDIRWSAVIGLGYFGAEARSALPALEKAKLDKDARVRNAASVAISRIGAQK